MSTPCVHVGQPLHSIKYSYFCFQMNKLHAYMDCVLSSSLIFIGFPHGYFPSSHIKNKTISSHFLNHHPRMAKINKLQTHKCKMRNSDPHQTTTVQISHIFKCGTVMSNI